MKADGGGKLGDWEIEVAGFKLLSSRSQWKAPHHLQKTHAYYNIVHTSQNVVTNYTVLESHWQSVPNNTLTCNGNAPRVVILCDIHVIPKMKHICATLMLCREHYATTWSLPRVWIPTEKMPKYCRVNATHWHGWSLFCANCSRNHERVWFRRQHGHIVASSPDFPETSIQFAFSASTVTFVCEIGERSTSPL